MPVGGVGEIVRTRQLTVTVKLHWLIVPLGSMAVQVTAVTPGGKREPEAGLQETLKVGSQTVG